MNKSFDAYVFDLDGTLLNTLPDLVVLTNKALEQVGLPSRTEGEILSYVGNGVKALMYQAVPEGTDDETTEQAMNLWMKLYPEYGISLIRPYEGIDQILELLKRQGKKLGVLSNKFDVGTKELIDFYFPNVFEVVYGVKEGIPRKPDPTGLTRVIYELESLPEKTIYVGDSPGDMLTAQRASCAGLCVPWGYHNMSDLLKHGVSSIVENPSQIPEWFPS